MSRVEKLIKYWKTSSDKDFKTATVIEAKTSEYVNALFLIHLSIEKCLKCYYVFKFKMDAPFTHNLLHLASKNEIEINDEILSFLTEINDFNIRCRYPDDEFKIYKTATKLKTKKMLSLAGDFRKWIFQKLN